MGLIKAAAGAIGSTLKDQWKEAIRCEDLQNDVLMVKKTTPTGVITNKSTIIVGPGQCAVIYDNGRVLDATAEEGFYVFDSSSSPTFFAGQFGDVFKEIWQRFTYNGATSKQQAVFFFNTKEIIQNKFGTANPIPFQDWSHPIPNQMTNTLTPLRVEIKCFGTYTFRIANPALFMQTIAGMADIYRKEELVEQMRTEVMAVFQNVVNELGNSEHKVPVLEMPSQTDEIRTMMNQQVFDENIRNRGLEIVGFSVESVSLDAESEKKIDNYESASNSFIQQGKLVDAYANAIQDAASNDAGSVNGFMGMGFMDMSTGGMFKGGMQGPWNSQNVQNSTIDMSKNEQEVTKDSNVETNPEASDNEENLGWKCECGNNNPKGAKFCNECGKRKVEKGFCAKCGYSNSENAKFCNNCGEKL